LLLHDNAHPHTANKTNEKLRNFLEHPSYSPVLAPSDFHLFSPLKHHLSAEHFPVIFLPVDHLSMMSGA
jgi:histone-lysine N-methyltransferase SETMAR